MNRQPISRWQSVIAFASIAKLSGFLKVNMVLGSLTSCFSAANMVMPVSGLWCGVGGSSILFFVRLALRLLFNGFSLPLNMLAHHIPGLFSGYYMASESSLIRLIVPIFCMAFFVLHPVGLQAWPYAMYWLIPVVLFFIPKKSLWFQALGSTFVAHGVGSVIWIYTTESTPEMWFALLPIVALERGLFTIGIVAFHKVLCWLADNVVIPRMRTA